MANENRSYLDWNATTPLRDGAREAMTRAMDSFGNPSSVHTEGRASASILRDAREAVAALVAAAPEQVTFTSGGTEANATVVRPEFYDRILISAIEHDSVTAAAKGGDAEVVEIPVDHEGRVLLGELRTLLQEDGGRTLVSVMLANNETGTIEPVADIVEIAREFGAVMHCDAIQAAGKIPISVRELGIDYISVSAHKIGGPKGVGALISARGKEPRPLIAGGGQERRMRGGTENLIGIAGFGGAAREAAAALDDWTRISALRDRIDDFVASHEGVGAAAPIVIAPSERLPNTTSLSLPGLRSDMMVMLFDLAGVALSAGSACSSGKVKASGVLSAMGAPEAIAGSALRISLGWGTTEADIERFEEAFESVYDRWRERAGETPRQVA